MTLQNIESRLTDAKYEDITSLISPERLERFRQALSMRTRKLVLCLEDIFHPHNASATIRTAEAFGLQEINVVETTCKFSPSTDIVRGTDKWIDLHHWDSTTGLVDSLKSRGYRIVITSPRPGSSTVEEFKIGNNPIALFFGTEKTGISKELEQLADDTLYIPMYGLAESLNISVSAAILIQRITEQIRKEPKDSWCIPEKEQTELLIKWIASSVRNGYRVVDRILDGEISLQDKETPLHAK